MDIVLFNIHDVVLLMTTYQCILFALLLVTHIGGNKTRNFLLAGFLLSHAFISLDILISFGEAFREWALTVSPNLFYNFGLAYWLEGPLLYWYTKSVLYKDFSLRKWDLLHLLPVVLYALTQLIDFYVMDYAAKVNELQSYNINAQPIEDFIVGVIREVTRAGYGVLTLWQIRNYRNLLKSKFSSIESINFSWLNILVGGFLMVRAWAVLVSVSVLLAVGFGVHLNYTVLGLTGNYAVFVLISILIFFSLNNSSVYEGIEEKPNGTKSHDKDPIKSELIERIVQVMEEEKPYLIHTLTLDELAERIPINARALSMIINRHFNRNFFEFVNYYRIEEAKKMLRDQSCTDKSVLNIMLDVGFNSKAAFNTFFKKFVGLTPSQYRKKMQTEAA